MSNIISVIRRYGRGSRDRSCGKLQRWRRFIFSSSYVPWPSKYPESPAQIKKIPMLMFSSPTNPQTRYLYEINDDNKTMKLNRKIHLPEIAGDFCIGSCPRSGFIFSLPTRCSPDMVAIHPFTGTRLPLPPTSNLPQAAMLGNLFSAPKGLTKAGEPVFYRAISPVDTAILIRRYFGINPWKLGGCEAAYFACLTSTTSTWNRLPLPNINSITDAIFHKNHLVLVNNKGTIATFVGSGDPLKPRPILRHYHENDEFPYEIIYAQYLVESPDGEDLFCVQMVSGMIDGSYGVQVLILDKNARYKWTPVTTLGGLAFFVGVGHSISLPAADHPGRLKPDSVYFANGYVDTFFDSSRDGLVHIGVYDLKDRTVELFQFADKEIDVLWLPPIWVVPDEP